MSLTSKLFSFEGRLRRRDWWALLVATALAQVLCSVVAVRSFGLGLTEAFAAPPFKLGWLVTTGVSLAFVWPNLALAVKRAHDRGMAGPAVVALILVSYVPILAPQPPGSTREFVLNLAVVATGLSWLVLLGVLDGTPRPNRYGPSPKAKDVVADVFS